MSYGFRIPRVKRSSDPGFKFKSGKCRVGSECGVQWWGRGVKIRRSDPGGGLTHVYMLKDYERTFERVKFLKLWT
jgi:hypothetical protein